MPSWSHGAEPEEKPLLWTSEYRRKMEKGMASASERLPDWGSASSGSLAVCLHTLETLREVLDAEEKGLIRDAQIIQAGFARSRKLADYHMMTGQNPIYIISSR